MMVGSSRASGRASGKKKPCLWHMAQKKLQSRWWLNQPLWKIWSSKWVHLPQGLGWKLKIIWNHQLGKYEFRKKLTLATGCVVGLGIYINTKSATWLSQPLVFFRRLQSWNGRKPPVLTTENLQDTKVIDRRFIIVIQVTQVKLTSSPTWHGNKNRSPKCCKICFFSPFLVVFHQPMRERICFSVKLDHLPREGK